MKGISLSLPRPVAVFAAALLFIIAGAASSSAHQVPEGFTGFEDPFICRSCHEVIFNEWSVSMHAASSKFGDPVHNAVYSSFTSAMKAQGKKPNYHCASCHAPTASNMEALIKGDEAPTAREITNMWGVTCAFCHKAESLVEGEGFHTYRVTDVIKGREAISARDIEPQTFQNFKDTPLAAQMEKFATLSHEVERSEFASSYRMCLGCHGKKVGEKGGVICSMEEEGVSDCLPCHMPQAPGFASNSSVRRDRPTHAFHGINGAHDPDMLRKGAEVSLGAEAGRLVVELKNPNPHYFPSTNPMRVAYVKVEVFGADGALLYTNFDKDPMADPKAVLIKVFEGGGKLGVPSWDAEGVAKDTRLAAGEDRLITYELPEGAARATARLFYRFVPGPAVEKFRIPKDGVVEAAHLVSEAEIKL